MLGEKQRANAFDAVGNDWRCPAAEPAFINCVRSGNNNNNLRVHRLRRVGLGYAKGVVYCSWLGTNVSWQNAFVFHRSSKHHAH